MNVKNAHISFSEALLTDVSYPVRNINGEVQLRGHKITTKDSTGVDKNYIITENFPDETIGMIVCILGDYADNPSEENQPSYIFKCEDASVINSDSTFTYDIPSGETFILPDITHVDSNGTDVVKAAQTPMVCTPNQALNISNSNDSFDVNTLVDLELPNIDFTDSDGTTSSVPSMENVVCTPFPVKSGIEYKRPMTTGPLVSYRVGDDKWREINMPYPAAPTNPLYCQDLVDFFTLKYDNEFGNRLRFTDVNGNATITSDNTTAPNLSNRYIVDNYTGLGMDWDTSTSQPNNISFNTAIDSCLSRVSNGFDDYYLPNMNESMAWLNFSGNLYKMHLQWAGGNRIQWSSTTYNLTTSNAYYWSTFFSSSSSIKSSSNRNYTPIRIHF